VYINSALPQPVKIPRWCPPSVSRTANASPKIRFSGLSDAVVERSDKLIFRHHRRLSAGARLLVIILPKSFVVHLAGFPYSFLGFAMFFSFNFISSMCADPTLMSDVKGLDKRVETEPEICALVTLSTGRSPE